MELRGICIPINDTGFSKYVEAEDADILVLTETKCDSLSLPSLDDRYPVRPPFFPSASSL